MIRLDLSVKDTVRIGSLQTSKNWESLEVVIKKLKVGCFQGSLTQGLFFMTVYKDAYKRPILCPRFGIIGIYETN